MPDFLLISILFASLALGFLAVLFNAFGTLIILLGAAYYGYAKHFEILTVKFLILLAGIALAGELVETILSYFGIKRMGGGNRSVFGAFIGGMAGAVLGGFFFGIGVVAGGLLGIFLGAALMDLTRSGNPLISLKVGFGGLLGIAGAMFVKILAALVMIQLIVMRVWTG